MGSKFGFLSLLVAAVQLAFVKAATLYLVGDSTMANQSASSGIQGWGVPVVNYLSITVVNKAISGRSARSYTREGRWAEVAGLLKSGDFVVIEFGHNDGGSPSSSDRACVVGEGSETETVTLSDGTTEVVYTWPTYVGKMIDDALAKGATPIISSQTPNNPYENSATIVNSPSRFVGYAKNIATKKNVPYVDHFQSCILSYQALGKTVTEGYFPNDHTHTNAVGADVVAKAFIGGLKCSAAKSVLVSSENSAGQQIAALC